MTPFFNNRNFSYLCKKHTTMAENKNNNQQQIKIELTPEIAAGHFANLAVIAHTPNEFFLDFITMAPNMPQARVQSRIIMAPENAKNLLMALRENIQRYEQAFGPIKQHKNPDQTPNPFLA